MTSYLIRRLLGMALVVLLVTVVLFVTMSFVPGDPISARYGIDIGALSSEQQAQLRKQYALDEPVPVQYWKWVSAAVRGDLGESIVQRKPVKDILGERVPVTMQIQIVALFLSLLIAIPFGVTAAVHQSTWPDRLINAFALTGIALPSFFLGLILLILFSVKLQWFPVASFTLLSDSPFEALRTTILPAVTAALGGTTALILRQVRSATVDELHSDYVRTARAKGLAKKTVLIRHAFRNAMLPTVTVVGISVGQLLGGSVIIERIFNIPGMGRLVIDAVQKRDYPMLQGVVLLIAIVVVVANLITDLAYSYLDPRIRLR